MNWPARVCNLTRLLPCIHPCSMQRVVERGFPGDWGGVEGGGGACASPSEPKLCFSFPLPITMVVMAMD